MDLPCRVMTRSPGSLSPCLAVRVADAEHSNTSMTIMRPPQHGHGGRIWIGSLAALSTGGRAAFRSSRARVMLSLSGTAGEQAVMPDAVEPARESVEQEASNELVGGKRHGPAADRNRRGGSSCKGR